MSWTTILGRPEKPERLDVPEGTPTVLEILKKSPPVWEEKFPYWEKDLFIEYWGSRPAFLWGIKGDPPEEFVILSQQDDIELTVLEVTTRWDRRRKEEKFFISKISYHRFGWDGGVESFKEFLQDFLNRR